VFSDAGATPNPRRSPPRVRRFRALLRPRFRQRFSVHGKRAVVRRRNRSTPVTSDRPGRLCGSGAGEVTEIVFSAFRKFSTVLGFVGRRSVVSTVSSLKIAWKMPPLGLLESSLRRLAYAVVLFRAAVCFSKHRACPRFVRRGKPRCSAGAGCSSPWPAICVRCRSFSGENRENRENSPARTSRGGDISVLLQSGRRAAGVGSRSATALANSA